ncbi:MAG TPA: primosomal protein N', partial [Rhizobiales bacterium]|nr:primosomal protein N' [Hyphomicrobiales bacterium]
GMVLRSAMRARGVFAPPKHKTAYRASGKVPERLTPQRARVLETARDLPAMPARELAELAGVGASVIKGLAAMGALEEVALPPFASFAKPDLAPGRVRLSSSQGRAAQALRQAVAARKFSVTLLDGVTGAGKTEVYFEAIASALAAGCQVFLMLPEIALTSTFIARVEERFGAAPGEWHSQMRPRQRERVWRAVAAGEVRIVVGARSGLFLPWRKPGLIIVDEEHDAAYKQSDGVAYHARDMAVVYGSLGRFPVILSSATPSLESLVNVDRKRYAHVTLKDRHGRAELPEIMLIDLRRQSPGGGEWLSAALEQAVAETLKSGDQALLFLNRRGYAPLTLCRTCGERLHCPQCSSWLVEHRFRHVLMCHHCGHTEPVPKTCPACQAEGSLVPCGPGIERLAEEAGLKFPDAKIAILSSDISRGGGLMETLRGIANGRYNLIIGTQLVAKGHHFPNLTLAGVVDADLALETSDPRAGERTWQLLAQVAGRAGRGGKPGRALIQTYMPDHPLLQALAKGDRDGFLAHEKHIRKSAGLPPYGQLAGIIISGTDQMETERFAQNTARLAPAASGISVLGPAPAPLSQIRGRYRYRLLVKSDRQSDIQSYLRTWLAGVRPRGSIRLSVDI